jgi:hypothetical protein
MLGEQILVARESTVGLANQVVQNTLADASILVPRVSERANETYKPVDELPLVEVGKSVGATLEPVADSAERAINMFARLIPGS